MSNETIPRELAFAIRQRVDLTVLQSYALAMAERAKEALAVPQSEVETASLRGEIKAYRKLAQLPIVIDGILGATKSD